MTQHQDIATFFNLAHRKSIVNLGKIMAKASTTLVGNAKRPCSIGLTQVVPELIQTSIERSLWVAFIRSAFLHFTHKRRN